MQEKACYDKRRDLQQKMHIKDVIDHFPYRQPSVSQIDRYINRQEWKNTNKAADVERAWLPASSTTSNPTLKLDNILKLIKTQVWKGQHIQQD
ncbi:hypothetical protein EOD39_20761 [Acipenser ruthenus]|uniref:Uncharacterized protein n=1 Tax=Acipenser ruthenus TaxID=7906 RepID=A0A444UUJ4_ACIRT|nr:hypothetical protein EOD39_20761 [Acipenser ruthenus]